MNSFGHKIYFLYLLLLIGFFLKRPLGERVRDVGGHFLVNYSLPLIFFTVGLKLKSFQLLSVALISFCSALVILLISYFFLKHSKHAWSQSTMAAWGNNAYMGIPLAFALFGARGAQIAGTWAIGSISLFAFVGPFIVNRSAHETTSLLGPFCKKVLFPPYIPAFVSGLVINSCGWPLSDGLLDFLTALKMSFLICSVIYVGSCLEKKSSYLNFSLIKNVLFFKHIVFPLVVLGLVSLDALLWQHFSSQDLPIILLMSFTPIAINTVILFRGDRELQAQAAFCVTLSTLLTSLTAGLFRSFSNV